MYIKGTVKGALITRYFDACNGDMGMPGEEVQELKETGVDAVAATKVGYRAKPSIFTTVRCETSLANANTTAQDYQNFRGVVAELEDQHGNVWKDDSNDPIILVVDVKTRVQRVAKVVGAAVGSSATHAVHAIWTFRNRDTEAVAP